MEKSFAVIDLGTNTFHIIIAQPVSNTVGFEIIFRERQFVKLAEEGIETIGRKSFERGLDALKSFKKAMDLYNVAVVEAVGTAALRTASNRQDFIKAAAKIGIKIKLIDGHREAELIGKGVKRAIPDFGEEKYLIMDIGGGSVEFIIADKQKVYWAESFPIGVAIMFKQFQQGDPIDTSEIKAIEKFLEPVMEKLREASSGYSPQRLIGASGTFDVLEHIIVNKQEDALYSSFEVVSFWPIYNELIKTTLEERFTHPLIPEARAEMLPAALVLIAKVIEYVSITSVVVSSFALKEGLLSEMIEAEVVD